MSLLPNTPESAMRRHLEQTQQITREFEDSVNEILHTVCSEIRQKIKVAKLHEAYLARIKNAATDLAHNLTYLAHHAQ